MRPRFLLAALALVLAAGCNSGTAGQQTVSLAERIRLAADSGTEAGTSKMFMKMDTPEGGFTAEGAYDFKALKGRLVFDFGEALGGMGEGVEMVQDGRVIYMRMPALAAQTGGKPWFKLDLDALAESGGLGSLDQLQNSDPTSTLAFLRGVADDVKEEGKEDVRGTETTRYAVNLDLDKAAELAGPEAKEGVAKAIEELGSSTIPMTVWIDGEDRLRRLLYSMDLSKIEPGQTGTVSITMELYDYGTKVDVSAPPADQVTDASKLLGGGASPPAGS